MADFFVDRLSIAIFSIELNLWTRFGENVASQSLRRCRTLERLLKKFLIVPLSIAFDSRFIS